MTDLFPDARSLSPRLAWMARYGVVVIKNAQGQFEAVITEDCFGAGKTEIEALEDLVETSGLPHWSL